MEGTAVQPIVTRKLEFDAGHRVLGHEGKCAHLHGHRYVAEVSVFAPSLDKLGRVIDFSCLKRIVGGWIDRNWDHNMILHPGDPLAKIWEEWQTPADPNVVDVRVDASLIFGEGKEPFLMPDDMNPTAENLSVVLYRVAVSLLRVESIQVARVRLYETPNCWSDFPVAV